MPCSVALRVICHLVSSDYSEIHLINLALSSNITHTLIRSLCSSSLGKMFGLCLCPDENTKVSLARPSGCLFSTLCSCCCVE